jgi:catechol 2,3-dioxygenase
MKLPLTADKPNFSIHPATKVGSISLNVFNLENQLSFYQELLGFHLHWHRDNMAGLGTSEKELLRLVEQPGFKRYSRVTGLYHFAILLPNRRELARSIARLFSFKYPNSPTDHIMTKTTYLDDPEGNGIELYTESPEDGEWFMDDGTFGARRTDGTLSNGREPLDIGALFSHLRDEEKLEMPIPTATRIGHVHLHIQNIVEAIDFYHRILGFDIMGESKAMRLAFVSAGGYHHHIGLNTWQGAGASFPPSDALGLGYFSIELPDQTELNKVIERVDKAGLYANQIEDGWLVNDPSQNSVLLKAI